MYEMSAPKLMLLQYNLRTGKQELKEVKQELENLIVTIKNDCNDYEVFEEGKGYKRFLHFSCFEQNVQLRK